MKLSDGAKWLSIPLLLVGPTWYDTSWNYRKAIAIDHTKVSGSTALTNFPMLTVTDTDLATGAQSSRAYVGKGKQH